MDIKPAPGKYSRTKLVTFTSRYVLINRLPVALLYRQPDPAADRSTAGMLVGGGLPLKDQSFYWKVLPGEQVRYVSVLSSFLIASVRNFHWSVFPVMFKVCPTLRLMHLQIPFHWPSNKLPKLFCMRLDYLDAVWSKGISFASVGSFDVKMARRDGTHTLVRTEIQLEKANTLIDFTFNVVRAQPNDYRGSGC